VPAAAVIRRSQALSGVTGRKEFVAGLVSLILKTLSQAEEGVRYCYSGDNWGLVELPVEGWNPLISVGTPKAKATNYGFLTVKNESSGIKRD
jgi:hypothetical protein